jgi:transcriptional regulatory protein RtcR
MATLAQGGRISVEIVEEEIERLKATWAALEKQEGPADFLSQILSLKALDKIDLFDRIQLAHVIQICRDSRSMSEAGRRLFDASRTRKTSINDADRLRKYLGRFGIEWNQIVES